MRTGVSIGLPGHGALFPGALARPSEAKGRVGNGGSDGDERRGAEGVEHPERLGKGATALDVVVQLEGRGGDVEDREANLPAAAQTTRKTRKFAKFFARDAPKSFLSVFRNSL